MRFPYVGISSHQTGVDFFFADKKKKRMGQLNLRTYVYVHICVLKDEKIGGVKARYKGKIDPNPIPVLFPPNHQSTPMSRFRARPGRVGRQTTGEDIRFPQNHRLSDSTTLSSRGEGGAGGRRPATTPSDKFVVFLNDPQGGVRPKY